MISAVVLTKNEEQNIGECLNTLKFCDEIVVVDDNSIDRTVKKAKKFGAKVYTRDMDKNYSSQSNFGMEKAGNKWVLFVDADERVTKKLADEIKQTLTKDDHVRGYYLKRIDYIWGRWLSHGEVGSLRLMRLVRKGSGKWTRRVHPTFKIEGETAELKHPLLHYPHQSSERFIESINRWSGWHALANKEENKQSTIFKIITYPPGHFIKNYLIKMGFLDGIQGFVFALFMSFHSFLAWSKLWMLQKGFTKI